MGKFTLMIALIESWKIDKRNKRTGDDGLN